MANLLAELKRPDREVQARRYGDEAATHAFIN